METLYTRTGTEFNGTINANEKGKPQGTSIEPCSRCGGAGGSQAWAFTGYTCYQCGGKNSMRFHVRTFPLYTQEQLTKMDSSLKIRQDKAAETDRRMNLYE